MRILVLVTSTALLATGCVVTPSVRSMLVGSSACPRINAHKGKACRFKKGGHGFQVWPERIRVKKTSVSGVYQVTQARLGDDDLMFDHPEAKEGRSRCLRLLHPAFRWDLHRSTGIQDQ